MKRFLALAAITLVGVSCAGSPLEAPPGAGKIIIDGDIGELNDDAQAMLMLVGAPGIEVLGVTSVGGNTWPEDGAAQARAQLDLAGHPAVRVIPGASATPAPRGGYSGAAGGPRPPPTSGEGGAALSAEQVA